MALQRFDGGDAGGYGEEVDYDYDDDDKDDEGRRTTSSRAGGSESSSGSGSGGGGGTVRRTCVLCCNPRGRPRGISQRR